MTPEQGSGSYGISVDSVVVEHHTVAGPVRALDGLSFALSAGSSVAITGPSGGGKSTLLGLLGGLARPTAGTVTIGDRDVAAMTDTELLDFRRREIGYVCQVDNLLPFLTLLENVQLPLSLVGNSADVDRCLHLLDRLGLADQADRLPDQLSGGQRQRGAVARAVVHRPTVILADEPTGALDTSNAAAVIELLVGVQTELGATLVMVTHDRTAARRLDQQLELARGRLDPGAGRTG
jgi:ABC-type lipoprotein export system ATPase subunit